MPGCRIHFYKKIDFALCWWLGWIFWTTIYWKQLISEHMALSNCLFNGLEVQEKHKSRWSKHSFCKVENSTRRKITKAYGYVPPPDMTRPLRRNFKLLFLVCRKYVYLKHKMFVHNLSVILTCMSDFAYTAKGCF